MYEALQEGFDLLQATFRAKLTEQGHVLTGRLRDSIVYEIRKEPEGWRGIFFIEDYGLYMEYGIPAERIPYSGRTGRGGKSKFIEGLILYFRKRGLSEKEAPRAAFATANVQRFSGMPTPNSRRFSSTGRRTGFAKESLEEALPKLVAIFERGAGRRIEVDFGKLFETGEKISVQK